VKEKPGGNIAKLIIGKTREELQQILNRKAVMIGHLEDAQFKAKENFELEIQQLKRALKDAKFDAAAWKRMAVAKIPIPKKGVDSAEKLDPEGYYRILGLHHEAFAGLSDKESGSLINKVMQIFAHRYHPDKGGDEKEIIKMYEAVECFRDPVKRAEYGK